MIRSMSRLSAGLPGTIAPVPLADFFDVEAQLRLAVLLVRAVAGEALVRQDRPHVAVEVDLARAARGRKQCNTEYEN